MEVLQRKIPDNVYQQLVQANIDSLKMIILLNNVELQDKAKINYDEASKVLQETAAILIEPKLKRAIDIPSWKKLTTCCKTINEITKGGIPVNGITEVYGCSGVGKTQFSLQLSLAVQLPTNLGGFGKGAVYICTEDIFPTKRLNCLSKCFVDKYNLSENFSFEDNIYVDHAADYEQLRIFVNVRLPQLLEKVPIGLIVLDSIGGLFRSESTSTDYVNRSEELFSISQKFREYSRKYELVALCINQVTDNPDTNQTEPALGHAWANLVTSRFEISRISPESTIRSFSIINAPDLPPNRCNFMLTNAGLQGID